MIKAKSRRQSLLFYVLFCLSVSLLAAISLHYSYKQVEANVERSLRHSSDLIAEWIVGAFAASDYVLRDIADYIDPAQLRYPHSDPHLHQLLTELLLDKHETVPHAFLIGVFNAQCIAIYTSAYVGFDASEREYCQKLHANPTLQSHITLAYRSNTGVLNVTQVRRLPSAEDEFLGFVAIGIDLDFFSSWLQKIELSSQSSIAILDHQGLLLARSPQVERAVGQRVESPAIELFLRQQKAFGISKMVSPIDGEKRLFGSRRVADLPFIVIVGLTTNEYLYTWRLQVIGTLFTLLILWLLATAILRKHWKLIEQSLQLMHMAHKDALTEIPNRAYFIELFERERQKSRRYGTPLSLLLLDLDKFKQINDSYGHLAGDHALLAFKDACQRGLREMDILGRWGGDEFVVLLPDGYDIAVVVAERLRAIVQQTVVTDTKGREFVLRTTIGFASSHGNSEHVPSLDQLFSYADRALYAAKKAGRNRVHGYKVESSASATT